SKTLVSAGFDGTVRLWDAGSHQQLGRALTGPKGLRSVAVSSDGTLAAGGIRSTVSLWSDVLLPPEKALKVRVCSLVSGPLSLAEWHELLPGLDYHAGC